MRRTYFINTRFTSRSYLVNLCQVRSAQDCLAEGRRNIWLGSYFQLYTQQCNVPCTSTCIRVCHTSEGHVLVHTVMASYCDCTYYIPQPIQLQTKYVSEDVNLITVSELTEDDVSVLRTKVLQYKPIRMQNTCVVHYTQPGAEPCLNLHVHVLICLLLRMWQAYDKGQSLWVYVYNLFNHSRIPWNMQQCLLTLSLHECDVAVQSTSVQRQ